MRAHWSAVAGMVMLGAFAAACSSGGGSGPGLCASAADKLHSEAQTLMCPNGDGATWQAQCEAEYSARPNCTSELDAFLNCVLAADQKYWMGCDDQGGPHLDDSAACPAEKAALDACK